MSEPRRAWIRVGRRRAHFVEAGAGPAVVAAPGLGLSTRFYAPTLAACARAGLRLIVPDLPGCGRTRGPLGGCSIPTLADWLVDFADRLDLERPGWLGHSVGCQIALEIAAAHGERAAALVLAAPTGAPGPHRLRHQLLALPRAAAREPADLILAVARDYLRILPSAYFGTWLRAGRDQPAGKLHGVRCPVLVLLGDRDPIARPDFVARLGREIEGARVVSIAGGGHGLPRDSADAFAAAAGTFLLDVLSHEPRSVRAR